MSCHLKAYAMRPAPSQRSSREDAAVVVVAVVVAIVVDMNEC